MNAKKLLFSSTMDILLILLDNASKKITDELKSRNIEDFKVPSNSSHNGIYSNANASVSNDRRMYYWITTHYRNKEYVINLFESEIDSQSGNCHCQLGKIMFTKDYIKNRSGASPNQIINYATSKNNVTTLAFNSNKWINPASILSKSSLNKLVDKRKVTVDDVLNDDNLTKELVDCFIQFVKDDSFKVEKL